VCRHNLSCTSNAYYRMARLYEGLADLLSRLAPDQGKVVFGLLPAASRYAGELFRQLEIFDNDNFKIQCRF